MPDMSGLDLLREIKKQDDSIEVVMMTGYPTISSAVEALKEGAYDYLSKPLILDELRHLMARVMERRFLRGEVQTLRTRLGEELAVNELIGNSAPMQRVKEIIGKVAVTDSPVLIEHLAEWLAQHRDALEEARRQVDPLLIDEQALGEVDPAVEFELGLPPAQEGPQLGAPRQGHEPQVVATRAQDVVVVGPAAVVVRRTKAVPEPSGLLTFRGDASRSFYGVGPVPRAAPQILWRYPATCGMCMPSTDESGKKTFWDIFVNNVSSSVGLCAIKLHRGDKLLFAVVSTSGSMYPMGLTGPSHVKSGTADNGSRRDKIAAGQCRRAADHCGEQFGPLGHGTANRDSARGPSTDRKVLR